MNKKTRKFYKMNINPDYHHEGYEFSNSFCISFIKQMFERSAPGSEYFDFKWKRKPHYYEGDCQIDCLTTLYVVERE